MLSYLRVHGFMIGKLSNSPQRYSGLLFCVPEKMKLGTGKRSYCYLVTLTFRFRHIRNIQGCGKRTVAHGIDCIDCKKYWPRTWIYSGTPHKLTCAPISTTCSGGILKKATMLPALWYMAMKSFIRHRAISESTFGMSVCRPTK